MCAIVIVKLFMGLTFSGHRVFYLDTEAMLSYNSERIGGGDCSCGSV